MTEGFVAPMTWWESFRTAGWTGAKLAHCSVETSIDALRRQIRGAKRREAAATRIAAWRRDLLAQGRVPLDELATLLKASALESAESMSLSPAFVDIEVDPAGRIRQIGVAIEFDGVQLAGEGTTEHVDVLSDVLGGRAVVAHNGAVHDFPRLEDAGVRLPPLRIDSLRWAWLAWPTDQTHSLGGLLNRHLPEFDTASLHDAVEDARALSALWKVLADTIDGLSPTVRASLRASLTGAVPDLELGLVLGTTAEHPVGVKVPDWRVDVPTVEPPLEAPRVCSRSEFDFGRLPRGSVVVFESLHEGISAFPEAGIVARPSSVLDHDLVESAPPGWAKALALRLMAVANGCVGLGPPAAGDVLEPLARRGTNLLTFDGQPLISDLATVSIRAPLRPLVLDVSLASLFEPVPTGVEVPLRAINDEGGGPIRLADLPPDTASTVTAQLSEVHEDLQPLATAASGFLAATEEGQAHWLVDPLDPGRHEPGVVLLVRGPVGSQRSESLWRQLLGETVRIEGAAAVPMPWVALDGLVTRSARSPGRRSAQLLGLAAGLNAAGESVVVIDTAAQRSAVQQIAAKMWWHRYGRHLLRPSFWPTTDEARRRLASTNANTALVGARTARDLSGVAANTIVGRSPLPSYEQRTMRRLVPPAHHDPFGEIIEPLAAHLAAELTASGAGSRTMIADPLLGTGVLAELAGEPTEVHIHELPNDDDLVADLLGTLNEGGNRRAASEHATIAATRRLLGPSGQLRDFQQAVIDDVNTGTDVLAVFRTGLGKSICYQVPALVLAASDAATVVVSPLLALQRDQLEGLRRKGVLEATAYNSDLPDEIRQAIRRGIDAGFYRIVLVAPEALHGNAIRRTLAEVDLGLLVIDEAHCVSEMGHDFRPDYRTLPRAIARVLGVPDNQPLPPAGDRPAVLALTGTANPQVIDDIKAVFS